MMKQYRGPAVETPPEPACDHYLPAFGCKPPMNASWIIARFVVLRRDELVEHRVHWADGRGEEQPSYRGWFRKVEGHSEFQQIAGTLVDWRPETGHCIRCGAPLPEVA